MSKVAVLHAVGNTNLFRRPPPATLGTAGFCLAPNIETYIILLILPIPSATMSAALKDDIKSAMSGVGVTLSGDMLSKCEFLCGVVELVLVLLRLELEKPAPSRSRQPRALTSLQSGHLEPQEARDMRLSWISCCHFPWEFDLWSFLLLPLSETSDISAPDRCSTCCASRQHLFIGSPILQFEPLVVFSLIS